MDEFHRTRIPGKMFQSDGTTGGFSLEMKNLEASLQIHDEGYKTNYHP